MMTEAERRRRYKFVYELRRAGVYLKTVAAILKLSVTRVHQLHVKAIKAHANDGRYFDVVNPDD